MTAEADVVEEALSSRGRIRIIRVLAEVGETNITQIVRRSSLNHKVADAHLKRLTSLGIVEEKRFGKIRMFRLSDRDLAKKICQLIIG